MRVLYVCGDPGIPLDGVKGASIHVRQTVGALERAGHSVTVLASGGFALRARRGVAREVEALAGSQRLLESIDPTASFDVVYERYSLWSLAGAALSESLAAPLVLEVNAPLVEEASRYRSLALGGLAHEIERFLLGRARLVLCVSSVLASRAAEIRGSAEGVHVVPNSVDTEAFRPRDGGAPSRPEGPEVVFAGSLKPWHGVDRLIEAFHAASAGRPGLRLRVIGDGPEREGLGALVESLGLRDRVVFEGAVPHERMPVLLRQADVGVAPYPPMDGFYFSPLKVGEYLATGLAVVASDCGDIAGVLEHGASALLVPPGDVPALAKAIGKLADDPLRRERLGRAARAVAVERFSLEAATRRLSSLLESTVGVRA